MKLTRTALATATAALVAIGGAPAADAANSARSSAGTQTASTRAESTLSPTDTTQLKRVLRKSSRSGAKTRRGAHSRYQALCEITYGNATNSSNYLGYVYSGNVRVCGWDTYFDVSVRVFVNGQLTSVGWIPSTLWNQVIRQYPSAR